ncbi:MAG: hypothetical protein CMJ96_06010 [Planctomycetes bacterium]|nr:hypothetical protein [Planctomycetota bacterium]
MTQTRLPAARRRRPTRGKVLFYAASKGDGSPRGWTFADLAFMTLCSLAVLFAVFFIVDWLLNTGFTFGK